MYNNKKATGRSLDVPVASIFRCNHFVVILPKDDLFSKPLFLGYIVYMAGSDFVHQWYLHPIAGMVISKSQFFLDSFGFVISFIVATPNSCHFKFFKSMSNGFCGCFRHISSTPERFPQPITEFTFIVLIRHISMPIQLQLYCTNWRVALFFAYCITFSNHLSVVNIISLLLLLLL